jgi:glycerol-3-phosphate O-acyltransferase
LKKIITKALRPLYFWLKKKYPASFDRWIQSAGNLNLSAMLTEFNLLHRFFFRKMFERVRFEKQDLEKIKSAIQAGPVIYMMRNWGQIEYNFFNSLFLREKLPLATRANLIRMHWWMPLKTFWIKTMARLDFFYQNGNFPESAEPDWIRTALEQRKTLFLFLNLPPILENVDTKQDDLILPILKATEKLQEGNRLTLIPLNFIYDRRPGKETKSMIDILFGEKENPGSLRKMVLFFRNHKKRAMAQVGEPLDVKKFLTSHSEVELADQCNLLRRELHQIFFKEKRAITGPRLKSRERMIEAVLQNPGLREDLKALTSELNRPLDSLYLEAEKILEEIVSDPNYTYIDLWDMTLNWVFKNIYDGLTVDETGLARVKQIARQHPIVLVPSHRSHIDYFLLSYLFYRQNLSMPLVAAGSNLSFWPMGYIFRKSGAYFIRRSFGNDKLYPLLFKTYVKTLIHEGYFQEFFIEGTRSRTGKLENPRTGLLSIFLDCFLEESTQDLYFVPISINYEKVLEEGSYIQEVKGAGKEKESFWDLFRVRKYLRRQYGQVYVNFAKPLSLKEYLNREGLELQAQENEKRELVHHLAHSIAVSIEEISIATAPAIVATAFLAHPKKGRSVSELFEKVELIRKALMAKNAPLSDPLQKNYAKALHQALSHYVSQGVIQEHHDGIETFYTLSKAHRARLNYYKNSLMHHLVHLSILATVLSQTKGISLSVQELESAYLELKNIFRYEFITILDFQEAMADLKNLGVIEVKDSHCEIKSAQAVDTLALLLKNFLEAYEITVMALERIQFSKLEEKTLVPRILELGNKLLLKGDIGRAESVSRFAIQNALQVLRDRGLILTHEKEMGKNGLKVYSSNPKSKEELDQLLKTLRGEILPREKKTSPLYLLKN